MSDTDSGTVASLEERLKAEEARSNQLEGSVQTLGSIIAGMMWDTGEGNFDGLLLRVSAAGIEGARQGNVKLSVRKLADGAFEVMAKPENMVMVPGGKLILS